MFSKISSHSAEFIIFSKDIVKTIIIFITNDLSVSYNWTFTFHISGEEKTGWAEDMEACLCIIACIPTDGLQPTHCYLAVSTMHIFLLIKIIIIITHDHQHNFIIKILHSYYYNYIIPSLIFLTYILHQNDVMKTSLLV